jgi:selenocysteine lyase/cysteine desulfurase
VRFGFSEESLDREFPVRKNLIYLNHAALSAIPARVAMAIAKHNAEVSNFGALNWKTWFRRYDELREKVATFVGAKPEEVAFSPSTSHSLNLVAQGYPWEKGDSVVGDDLEFPSNSAPWRNLAARGVEYREAESRDGRVTAEDLEALIASRTRIVAVSWVAFHSGFVFPLREIGQLCRRRDLLLVVDGIQGLGTMPIDVHDMGIDVLAADGHKFLYSSEAGGPLYVSKKAQERLGVPWVGWWNLKRQGAFLNAPLEFFDSARRYEPGSLPTAQLCGLSASLDLLNEIGMEAAQKRIASLVGRLREGLAGLGWKITTPEGSHSAILAALPPSGNPRAVARKLEEHKIIVSAREGGVRFSPHVGNSLSEIERALEAIRALEP